MSLQSRPDDTDDDIARGFIRYLVRVYFPDADCGIQLVHVGSKALALEVADLLRPEFPAGQMQISQWATELSELAEAKRITEKVKALVFDVLKTDRPGHEFLTAIGYRPKPTEV